MLNKSNILQFGPTCIIISHKTELWSLNMQEQDLDKPEYFALDKKCILKSYECRY